MKTIKMAIISVASAALLPFAAIAEDPYVESLGTCGISTGYRMKGGISRVEVDYALTDPEHSNQMRIFGDYSSGNEKTLKTMVYFTGTDGQAGGTLVFRIRSKSDNFAGGSHDYTSSLTADGTRRTLVTDLKNCCQILTPGDDTLRRISYTTPAFAGLVADLPLSLFAEYGNTNATAFSNAKNIRPAKAKIYGVKIYENYEMSADDNSANLVHDFVPCLKSGVACFKDLVTGSYIIGENVDGFTAGGDGLLVCDDDPYVSTVSGAGSKMSIDTGWLVTDSTAVELECAIASNMIENATWFLFDSRGSDADGEPARFSMLYNPHLSWSAGGNKFQTGFNAAIPKPSASGRDVRRVFTLDNFGGIASVSTHGFTNISESFAKSAETSGTKTLKLGSYYSGGNLFAPLKIYGCRIYESGELVRDFKPFIKSGVAGLRDELTGAFVAGEDRSGAGNGLVPGGNVPCEDPYIEMTGASTAAVTGRGFSTGYRMKGGISRVEVDYRLTTTNSAAQWRIFGDTTQEKTLGTMFYYTGTAGEIGASHTFRVRGAGGISGDSMWSSGELQYANTNRYTLITDLATGTNAIYASGIINSKGFNAAKFDGLVADLPLSLFAQYAGTNSATRFANNAKARIYGVRIYEGGSLVHNFTPAVKDGVACFRDLTGGGFIVAEDVTAFTASDNAPEYDDDFYVSTVPETEGENLYIDTGYQVKSTTRVELDCALGKDMSSDAAWILFDARDNKGTRFQMGYIYTTAPNFALKYAAKGQINAVFDGTAFPKPRTGKDVRRTFILDIPGNEVAVMTSGFTNRAVAISGTTAYSGANNSLKIACAYDDTWEVSSSGLAPLKIYGCRIYESGELVRNFTPYIKDGVAGLRDTVGGGFVCGKCKTGSAAGTDTNLPYGGDCDPYIESDGQSGTGLSTGYFMKGGISRVEVDYRLVEVTPAARIFGNDATDDDADEYRDKTMRTAFYVSDNGTNFNFYVGKTAPKVASDANNCRMRWRRGVTDSTGSANTMRHTAIVDMKDSRFTGMTAGVTNWTSQYYHEANGEGIDLTGLVSSMPLPLFNRFLNNEGTEFSYYPAHARIYSVKIYENDALVHDFIPYMKAGVPGMYDLVDRTFVTGRNATGNNTFVLGGAFQGEDNAYIESDGTSGFNTGYRMKGGISRVEVEYQLTNTAGTAQMRVFGTTGANETTLRTCFYYPGDGRGGTGESQKFYNRIAPFDAITYEYGIEAVPDTLRHRLVDDLKNCCQIFTVGDNTIRRKSYASPVFAGATATLPLSVFGSFSDSAGTSYLNGTGQYDSRCTAGRIYAVRIYENYNESASDNSANLVHEFIPYSKGGTIGFYDTKTGEVKPINSAAFSFGSSEMALGVNKTYIKPPERPVVVKGSSLTLEAYASGAASYRWFADGAEIPGETGDTLAVQCEAGVVTREYTALAVFTDGTETRCGEISDPATLTFVSGGTLLLFR